MNSFWRWRVAYAPEDPEAGGGGSASSDSGNGNGQPTEAELALQKEKDRADALQRQVDQDKENERKRQEAERRRKAQEEGKTQELLTQREQELEELRKRNDALEAGIRERAENQLSNLPQDVQDRLNKYKDKVELGVWTQMIDDAAIDVAGSSSGAAGDNGGGVSNSGDGAPPPAGGMGDTGMGGKDGMHKPSEFTKQFLTDMGRPNAINLLGNLEKVVNPENPRQFKFRKPVLKFFEDMLKYKAKNLSRAELVKRGG